jgi:hypothetical protein
MHPMLKYLPAVLPLALAACATSPADPPPAPLPPAPAPAFTSVQPDLLGVAGSLSNVWGDFDNDGDPDLAVSLKSGEIRLYRNDGGTLVSIGAAMGLPTTGYEFRGLSWGDYDGDGWLDLFGGATDPTKPSVMFRNQGGKSFVNVAADVGLEIPGRSARQSNWVDYDNDGDLDLYATDRIKDNKLYRNDGGKFVQAFAGVGPTDARPTVGACWLDYDYDGDLDLYLANQSGATDSFWRNDGTAFVDVAPELGMDMKGRDRSEGGVGCAVGDFDNDGHLDIFIPNYGHNVLWRANGDGTFTNVAVATGVGVENHAVGASWGDLNNDGFLDLSVMSYEGPSGEQQPQNSLWVSQGGKTFVDIIAQIPLVNAGDHGVGWVDYDQDGAVDLTLTDGYSPVGGHFVFRNDLPAEWASRSLSVMVLDSKGHFTRFGAEVRLYDAAGKILGARQVETGGGYNAQSAIPVHFGVPSGGPVTVEVTFMSSSGRKVQKIEGVKLADYAGKSLVVKEK